MSIFAKLNNLYWRIQYTRNKSEKRKFYRYVAAEKQRLIESGVDREELRLICRVLANRLNFQLKDALNLIEKISNKIAFSTSSPSTINCV